MTTGEALAIIIAHAEENIYDCTENAGSDEMYEWGEEGKEALQVILRYLEDLEAI